MANDKGSTDKQPQQQQTTQSDTAPVNPFRDAEGAENNQPTQEEQTELEQQRKEALTERD